MTRVILLIDNDHYADDGSEVPADKTIRIAWQVGDGEVEKAELDLTGPHIEEYLVKLRHLTRNANSGSAATPAVRRALEPAGDQDVHRRSQHSKKASPVRHLGLKASRDWRKDQQQWADLFGITRLDNPELPAYLTPAGGRFPPAWLDQSYTHFLETGEVIIPCTKGQWKEAGQNPDRYRAYMMRWKPSRTPHAVISDGLAGDSLAGGNHAADLHGDRARGRAGADPVPGPDVQGRTRPGARGRPHGNPRLRGAAQVLRPVRRGDARRS